MRTTKLKGTFSQLCSLARSNKHMHCPCSGERIADLKAILGRVAECTCLFDDDGISVRYDAPAASRQLNMYVPAYSVHASASYLIDYLLHRFMNSNSVFGDNIRTANEASALVERVSPPSRISIISNNYMGAARKPIPCRIRTLGKGSESELLTGIMISECLGKCRCGSRA